MITKLAELMSRTSRHYGKQYSASGMSMCAYKRCWKWCPRNTVSKNWIKQLHAFTGIALQPLFNNWIQWNNSTLQQQLRYWQPNLRTIAKVHSDFPNALFEQPTALAPFHMKIRCVEINIYFCVDKTVRCANKYWIIWTPCLPLN
jgi:hypothetical protein